MNNKITSLPDNIVQLKKLETLNLQRCNFEGYPDNIKNRNNLNLIALRGTNPNFRKFNQSQKPNLVGRRQSSSAPSGSPSDSDINQKKPAAKKQRRI